MGAEPFVPDYDAVFDAAFWDEERDELRAVLLPIMVSVILEGLETGALQLADVGLGADVDNVIDEAMRYANTMTDRMLSIISRGNRAGTGGIIKNWIEAGEDLPTLLKRLEKAGIRNARATGITEVTRAFSAGQRIVWDQSGFVEARQWHAVGDEKMCPVCGKLDGTVQPLYSRFTVLKVDADGNLIDTGQTVGSLLAAAGFELNPFGDPPAHPYCRCVLLPVVVGFGLVMPSKRVLRRMYRFWDRWAMEEAA